MSKVSDRILAHADRINGTMKAAKILVGVFCIVLAVAKNFNLFEFHISFLETSQAPSDAEVQKKRFNEHRMIVVALLGVGVNILLHTLFPKASKLQQSMKELVDEIVPGLRARGDRPPEVPPPAALPAEEQASSDTKKEQ